MRSIADISNETWRALARDGDGDPVAAVRLFQRVEEPRLLAHSLVAGTSARLGAVAFIHRFGSTLHSHLRFHCEFIEGVSAPDPVGIVSFHDATGLDERAIA